MTFTKEDLIKVRKNRKDSALSSTVEGSQAEYDFVNKDEEDAYRDYCEQQAKDNGGYPEE
jgi:hypothetical protein